MIRLLLLRCLVALGLLCFVTLAGCQSLEFPWSGGGELPAQWEPDVDSTAARGE